MAEANGWHPETQAADMSDTPPQKRLKLTGAAAAAAASSDAVPFQLLSLLPPPLLALVACHLDYDDLLRMQPCSSALHRLRLDESYMAVAWSSAKLCLNTHTPLLEWSLLDMDCVIQEAERRVHGRADDYIPVRVWQIALPALRAAVAKQASDERDERRRRQQQQLRQWVEQPQTEWVPFRTNQAGWLLQANDPRRQLAPDVGYVEVMKDVTVQALREAAPQSRDVEVRCRLILLACPYLQHLEIDINAIAHVEPSHEDTFVLVPLLRSLKLTLMDNINSVQKPELLIDTPPIDFERMLDSLPRLTSLHCEDVYISISDLLDLASHSTLEQLHLETRGQHLADKRWLGDELLFPIHQAEDELLLEQAAAGVLFDAQAEEEKEQTDTQPEPADGAHSSTSDCSEKVPAWTRDDVRRMQAALTRTQPTRRSCQARLALADWLHRRLRRAGLHTDADDHPAWLLRHYRSQVALLRSTLQRQLSELTVAGEESVRRERLRLLHQRWEHCRESWLHTVIARSVSRYKIARLLERLDRMSATERSMAVLERAKFERDCEVQLRRRTELAARMQLLAEQVLDMQRSMQAAQWTAGGEAHALMEQMLAEGRDQHEWMRKQITVHDSSD